MTIPHHHSTPQQKTSRSNIGVSYLNTTTVQGKTPPLRRPVHDNVSRQRNRTLIQCRRATGERCRRIPVPPKRHKTETLERCTVTPLHTHRNKKNSVTLKRDQVKEDFGVSPVVCVMCVKRTPYFHVSLSMDPSNC